MGKEGLRLVLSHGQKRPEKISFSDRVAAWAFRGARRFFSFLGPAFTLWFFGTFLTGAYRRSSPAKVIRRNIDLVYADQTDEFRDEIYDGVTGALPLIVAEFLLQAFWRNNSEKFTTHNLDADWLQPYLKNEKRAVFLIGHLAGWETNIMTVSRYLKNTIGIYAPPKNVLLEHYFKDGRVVDPQQVRVLPRDLANLQDQLEADLISGSSLLYALDAPLPGPMLPFAGLESPTTLRPYEMAAKAGVPVIPLRFGRDGKSLSYWIEAEQPIFAKGSTDQDIRDFATEMNATYTRWIFDKPKEWYWADKFFMPNRRWVALQEKLAAKAQDSKATSQ